MKWALTLLILLLPVSSFAEDTADDIYPQFSKTFMYIYEDYITAYDRVFSEQALPYWWAIGLSTAALVAVDDKLIDEAQRLGRRWDIASEDHTTTVFRAGGINILRLPRDLGSWLYFIGDGWTHASIAAGFLATGAIADDNKAYSVGYQLVEGMMTTTIATQTLKHLTGRESPTHATTPTGRWDLFPNQGDYFDCIPCYDAFPSGHVAVSAMTLTVLSKNYPDNPWIMPVGVTLISLLSFQMMNNEVHWASDYPLAIGLGYVFGEIAYERGQRALVKDEVGEHVQWMPMIGQDSLGLAMFYRF